ncbi:MAG: nucleotidyltransferase domain-containing protein [Thermoguttaceae bacterium]
MTNSEITAITQTIVETASPEKVFLFGSHAYGNPDADSDYDFFVVMPDNSVRDLEVIQNIRLALLENRILKSIDILSQKKTVFAKKSALATLERKISREGVLLYERITG